MPHGLLRLHLKEGCPPHSGGGAHRLGCHGGALILEPRPTKLTDFTAFDHTGGIILKSGMILAVMLGALFYAIFTYVHTH